jgi:lysozyme family protein
MPGPLTNLELDQVVARIVAREGGFVNNPADPGGATKYGITIDTLSSWRDGAPVTPADVAALTIDEASSIYLHDYILMPGFDALPSLDLCDLATDSGVLFGREVGAKWVQIAVGGLTVDGNLGPKTRAALEALTVAQARQVYLKICAIRFREIGRQITAKPVKAIFAAGWLNRSARFVELAP